MTTQHTPGPWRVGAEQSTELFGYAYAVHAISNDDGLVAAVPACTGAATAALIAAAPKMYAALQLIRDVDAATRLTDRERVAEMSRIAGVALANATQE